MRGLSAELTEGEKTTPQAQLRCASSPDKGSLMGAPAPTQPSNDYVEYHIDFDAYITRRKDYEQKVS